MLKNGDIISETDEVYIPSHFGRTNEVWISVKEKDVGMCYDANNMRPVRKTIPKIETLEEKVERLQLERNYYYLALVAIADSPGCRLLPQLIMQKNG